MRSETMAGIRPRPRGGYLGSGNRVPGVAGD
jgi:hypothetical protein